MPKEDEYLNKFKTALTSTIKAIAEDPELEVKFGNSITSKKKFICLPETKDIKSDYTHIRALADSEALKIKYTDNETYLQNQPKNKLARDLYFVAEIIRCEKIGSNRLMGVRKNITENYKSELKNLQSDLFINLK